MNTQLERVKEGLDLRSVVELAQLAGAAKVKCSTGVWPIYDWLDAVGDWPSHCASFQPAKSNEDERCGEIRIWSSMFPTFVSVFPVFPSETGSVAYRVGADFTLTRAPELDKA